MSDSKTFNRKTIGDSGEDLAAIYLQNIGYKIIAKKFRTRRGEIDIVAVDGDTLVFVEVKTRNNEKFGNPIAQITQKKANRIYQTAEEYIVKQNCRDMDCRIDAICVNMDGEAHDYHVEHFINSYVHF